MPDAAGAKRLGIRAIIVRFQHQWFADTVVVVETPEPRRRYPITIEDAWNFDIEHGLPVLIKPLSPETCRVLSRKGNKKFVTVSAPTP